jgi:hypothetical protein
MAHFAELDNSSKVIRVVVTDNDDPNGDEGYQWLIENFGGTWIKTSYNTFGNIHNGGGEPFRKNYAGIGYTYDPVRDAFIPPKQFESWILNEETCLWEAPVPYPAFDDENPRYYEWNEDILNWEEIQVSE